ncbi:MULTISPECIES: hypothetical protein [Enterococcus]|uniref:hypothetical protein n=1 Tax=Enterococcus TaxID=1350 RepID=UPI0004484D87|nr:MULTISPECIES: hypothetical protein [Enterococcus]EYT94605.1 hypothetical protein AK89_12990 [Enterococcus mundtii CRL35]SFE58035.1 hypothetical protein SAMN04487887_1182 [Enterococcus casseliflavus]
MTRRLFYFLLSISLLGFSVRHDLEVSAQEFEETPVWLGFTKQEKQENPDYLPPVVPERIPNDEDKQPGRLPQLNQQSLNWSVYSGGLCICLIVFRLAYKKRSSIQREGA